MVYIYLFTMFDAYLVDILRIIFLNDPRTINSSKKTVKIEDVINMKSFADVINNIIENELYDFGYKSVTDQIKYF